MIRQSWVRWLLLPILATVIFGGLVALNLNGSSLSLLGRGVDGEMVGVVAGKPRPVRSDEWGITTPLTIQAVEQGFAPLPYVGPTPTDTAIVVNTGPSWNWIEIFKPQDWGYFTLGADRGLAWHWWFSFWLCLSATFLLVMQLTRNGYLSVLAAAMVTFSPFTAWWSAPSTALIMGFGTGAAFLLVRAYCSPRRHALAYSAAAGVSLACMIAVAYPPWTIVTLYAIGALVLGIILDNWVSWRRAAATLVPAALSSLVVVGAWFVFNKAAWAAYIGTYYPGQRVGQSGQADLAFLQSAPWNFIAWLPTISPYVTGNQSRNSNGWVAIPLVLAGVAVGLASWIKVRRKNSANDRELPTSRPQAGAIRFGLWVYTALGSVFVLLVAWAVVPGLDAIGKVTLLSRVPSYRVAAGVTIIAALILVLSVVSVSRMENRRYAYLTLIGGVVLTGVLAVATLGQTDLKAAYYRPTLIVAAIVLFAVACLFLYIPRALPAFAVLVSIGCFAMWLPVNPLVAGLGPIPTDPVTVASRQYLERHPDARFIVTGSREIDALVRASGAQSISGSAYYPDWATMEKVFPGQESVWNNYQNYVWEYSATTKSAAIRDIEPKRYITGIDFNPCSPQLRAAFGVNAIVSARTITSPCLTKEMEARRGKVVYYFYRILPTM